MNKFKCNNKNCKIYNDTEFNYPVVVKRYKLGESLYYFEDGEEIKCPHCIEPLVEIQEFKGYGQWLGSFDSRSLEEKREILKKREVEHSKRDKNFQEYKKYMDYEAGE